MTENHFGDAGLGDASSLDFGDCFTDGGGHISRFLVVKPHMLIRLLGSFSLIRYSTCLGFNPVKLNIPICLVMWFQVPGILRASIHALNSDLMVRIQSTIVFTSPVHSLKSSGLESTLATIHAP